MRRQNDDWRLRWVKREAFEFKVLAVVFVAIGSFVAIQDDNWLMFVGCVLGAWAFVVAGEKFQEYMTQAIRRRDEPGP